MYWKFKPVEVLFALCKKNTYLLECLAVVYMGKYTIWDIGQIENVSFNAVTIYIFSQNNIGLVGLPHFIIWGVIYVHPQMIFENTSMKKQKQTAWHEYVLYPTAKTLRTI